MQIVSESSEVAPEKSTSYSDEKVRSSQRVGRWSDGETITLNCRQLRHTRDQQARRWGVIPKVANLVKSIFL